MLIVYSSTRLNFDFFPELDFEVTTDIKIRSYKSVMRKECK